jgi:hypothetical protein
LLASKDQTLLIRRDAFLVLDLLLDVVDRVGGLYLESDGLASEGLDEDLQERSGGGRREGGEGGRTYLHWICMVPPQQGTLGI